MNSNTIDELNQPYIGGPRTEAGRETSSRNATKHGLCTNTVRLLPTENPEDYTALEATWFNAYKPKDEAEIRLIKQLVDADFLLERANRTLSEVEAQIYEGGYLPLNWSDNQHFKLARITRYQTARANAITKARKAVEDYRKNRVNEVIKAEKHEAFKQKAEPEPTVAELLDDLMRQKQEHDRKNPPDPDRK